VANRNIPPSIAFNAEIKSEETMNGLIYLVGLIVIILFILGPYSAFADCYGIGRVIPWKRLTAPFTVPVGAATPFLR
jgi:hypothetical protein